MEFTLTPENMFSPEATKYRWFEWRENPDTACNCRYCQYQMFGSRYYRSSFKDTQKDAERAWNIWLSNQPKDGDR